MARLTYKLGELNPSYGLVDKASAKPGLFTDYDGFYAHLIATHRLGEYEDTGFSPAEVAELAQAKADGRLVVLPCKIGENLYMIATRVDGKSHIRRIILTNNNMGNVLSRLGEDIYKTKEKAEKVMMECEQQCRICGCTWNNACEGGCYWVKKDLCSKCALKECEVK